PSVEQCADLRIVTSVAVRSPGRAEGGELSVRERQLPFGALEEIRVQGNGAGPAGLDEVHPERVEPAGDGQLVRDGQRQAFLLYPVAQGRVIDLHRSAVVRGHLSPPCHGTCCAAAAARDGSSRKRGAAAGSRKPASSR